MLTANSTRDMNQAARVAKKFLGEQGFEMLHSKALDLVARMVGSPHYLSAQASMQETGLKRPALVQTYADLKTALMALNDEQLLKRVSVSEGCDENGNAVFFGDCELMRADDGAIHAGTDGLLEGLHPVLLFKGGDAGETDVSSELALNFDAAKLAIEDLCRILVNPDVDASLHREGISDAAYASLAVASTFVSDEVLRQFPHDVLRQAYDELPISCGPEDFVAGRGGGGLDENEFFAVSRLASLLVKSPCTGSAPAEDAARIGAQFEMSTACSGTIALQCIRDKGLDAAVAHLNETYEISLSLGPLLVASKVERGFWCAGFGWTTSKMAATGYSAQRPLDRAETVGCPDARHVTFADAVDFSDENAVAAFEATYVAGEFIKTSAGWEIRYLELWKALAPKAHAAMTRAAVVLAKKGFRAEIVARGDVHLGLDFNVWSKEKPELRDSPDGAYQFVLTDANVYEGFFGAGLSCEVLDSRDNLVGSLSSVVGTNGFATEAKYFNSDTSAWCDSAAIANILLLACERSARYK